MPIAITGGIAEGKSTVLALLAEHGFRTASSDAVSKLVFERPEINRQLAEMAGCSPAITSSDLRAAIHAQVGLRQAVNRLMHPLIRAEMTRIDADFVEVPLLIEACLYGQYEQVWVVTCGQAEQRRRLLSRYGVETDIEAILLTQLPTRAKLAFANEVIRTNCTLKTVRRHISRALERRFAVS